jgi:Spy/CpxP family protein refolding chaperone
MPAAAAGQDVPPGKWWQIPQVSRRLDLTAGEKNRLDDLFYASRRKLIELKGRVESEQLKLDHLLEAANTDQKAVEAQFERLESARSALADERFQFLLEVRRILGFERFRELKMIYREFMHRKTRRPRPPR